MPLGNTILRTGGLQVNLKEASGDPLCVSYVYKYSTRNEVVYRIEGEIMVMSSGTGRVRPVVESSCSEIPVVDLSWDEQVIVAAISEACAEWGFFQVVNHGVECKTINDIELAVQEFFIGSSPETKAAVHRTCSKARGKCLHFSLVWFIALRL